MVHEKKIKLIKKSEPKRVDKMCSLRIDYFPVRVSCVMTFFVQFDYRFFHNLSNFSYCLGRAKAESKLDTKNLSRRIFVAIWLLAAIVGC